MKNKMLYNINVGQSADCPLFLPGTAARRMPAGNADRSGKEKKGHPGCKDRARIMGYTEYTGIQNFNSLYRKQTGNAAKKQKTAEKDLAFFPLPDAGSLRMTAEKQILQIA